MVSSIHQEVFPGRACLSSSLRYQKTQDMVSLFYTQNNVATSVPYSRNHTMSDPMALMYSEG